MFIDPPVALPPFGKVGKKLESMVRKAIFTYNMLENTTKIAIALSGGKDSLTLLFLLHALSGRGFPPFEITAIHVHGEYSCGAQVSIRYLEAICKKLNVPFISIESSQTQEDLECYSCSRERRRLLFQAAKEHGCSTIAFGHHKDDYAQTVLMNLLHKAEFAGALPKIHMYDYDITIIRPLIFAEEKMIIGFATYYNFLRITCQCPVGAVSLRRKTEELLQHIEKIYPNARENIAQAALQSGSTKAAHKDRDL